MSGLCVPLCFYLFGLCLSVWPPYVWTLLAWTPSPWTLSVWMFCLHPVCQDAVGLACVCPHRVCLGPLGLVCLDPASLNPVGLDAVCLQAICLDRVLQLSVSVWVPAHRFGLRSSWLGLAELVAWISELREGFREILWASGGRSWEVAGGNLWAGHFLGWGWPGSRPLPGPVAR